MVDSALDSGTDRGRARRDVLLLVAITLVALLPFVGKAFHIDDPLFLWAGKQIQAEPLDPYGFTVNWYGVPLRMSDVTKNPPLASYYIAAAATLFGWGEVPLHVAFLVPALAVVLFSYLLGRRFTGRPLLAASFVLAMPVFLVSSTSVMCDVWMLALWLASIWLWVTGLDRDSIVRLVLGALAVSFAILTKYFGLALLPLLLATTWRRDGRLGRAWPLLIPVAAAAAYHVVTAALYGRGLLLDAFSYSGGQRPPFGAMSLLTDLAFVGGCVGVVALVALLGRRRRTAIGWIAGGAAVTVGVMLLLGMHTGQTEARTGRWDLGIHLGVFATLGVAVLALAAEDLRSRRDADSLLLALWVTGTFVFAALINWSTNGRSILPMAPAVALLIARGLETADPVAARTRERMAIVIACVSGVVAWSVAWADVQQAKCARQAAEEIGKRAASPSGRLLFEGHWGFQYYLEPRGGIPLDWNAPLHPGDRLVLPVNNTNVATEPQPWMRLWNVLEVPSGAWIAVHRFDRGAGFYADLYGPVPYVFGPVPPDRYPIFEVFDPAATP